MTTKLFFSFLLIGIFNSMNAQLNIELKRELDSILYLDQEMRKLFDNEIDENYKNEILSKLNIDKEEFNKSNWSLVIKQDSLNLEKISLIIKKYGYPGKTLVGEDAAKAAWYVIQHSNSIEEYFPIIKEAGENHEIPMTLVAMMEDRMLMEQGKEQLYGTQIKGEEFQKGIWTDFVWPIKDVENVNKRRLNLGFTETVEKYALRFNIEYKVLTLEDVQKLRNTK